MDGLEYDEDGYLVEQDFELVVFHSHSVQQCVVVVHNWEGVLFRHDQHDSYRHVFASFASDCDDCDDCVL